MKKRERDQVNQARIEAKWGKKGQREKDCLERRDGDSFLIPFECDLAYLGSCDVVILT